MWLQTEYLTQEQTLSAVWPFLLTENIHFPVRVQWRQSGSAFSALRLHLEWPRTNLTNARGETCHICPSRAWFSAHCEYAATAQASRLPGHQQTGTWMWEAGLQEVSGETECGSSCVHRRIAVSRCIAVYLDVQLEGGTLSLQALTAPGPRWKCCSH